MKRILLIAAMLCIGTYANSQTASDYLIIADIGTYKKITKGGPSGSILAGADHFGTDHKDYSYGISYVNDESKVWIDVQVTITLGSDSDKWLLHEVESKYRSTSKMGPLISGSEVRDFNGNKVLNWISYSWVSNNFVVNINWTPKPDVNNAEPIEIIQAYLQKFPSTIPASFVLDKAHDIAWIKDEMDRRLWLCDKWFMQLQLGKVQQPQVLQESAKSMNLFLDYREKYYGLKAADEKNLLSGYIMQNDGTGIKAKLDEYKKWWAANKDKAINI